MSQCNFVLLASEEMKQKGLKIRGRNLGTYWVIALRLNLRVTVSFLEIDVTQFLFIFFLTTSLENISYLINNSNVEKGDHKVIQLI